MRMIIGIAASAALAAASGCAHRQDHEHEGGMHSMEHMQHMRGMGGMGPTATATLEPTRGSSASGTVTFMQHGDHMMVIAKLSGLKPNQEHGFHAHEKGDCSSGDGMSTGGHYNPTGKPHGPQNADHHAGDFPALKADANGNADARFHLMGVTLGAGPADLLGKAVIVHANPDDYKTQPTGNAGPRIACGVIRAAP